MSNTKTSWTEYKNREDVTLEDEECITDFRIDEGYSMSAGIYTFNFIVTDKNISSIDTELIFT